MDMRVETMKQEQTAAETQPRREARYLLRTPEQKHLMWIVVPEAKHNAFDDLPKAVVSACSLVMDMDTFMLYKDREKYFRTQSEREQLVETALCYPRSYFVRGRRKIGLGKEVPCMDENTWCNVGVYQPKLFQYVPDWETLTEGYTLHPFDKY